MSVLDDIPPELLERLPELESTGGARAAPATPFPFRSGSDDGPAAAAPPPGLPLASASNAEADLMGALADVRRTLEAAFQHEMDRMERSFAQILRTTETRLVQANMELMTARAEHEHVKAEHARKAETLKELKRTLEGLR
jgi:hypothetical protein